jgi:hypothetical protein
MGFLNVLFADGAAWFAVPALVGTLGYMLRLVLSAIGVGDGDADDVAHVDHGAHTGGDLAATALSVQGFLTFLMGFGWGGLGGFRGSDLSLGLSALIGIGCGIVLLLVVVFLLRATRRLQSSGNITLGDLVGLEAEVYTTIPASGQGRGQIVTVVGDRQRFVNAVSDAAEIPPRTRIAVVRVNGDNSVTVRRLDTPTT